MIKHTLLALLLFGCSSDPSPRFLTWGEVVEDLSVTYCETVQACNSTDVQLCIDHNVSHLCELERTCDQKTTEEQRMAATQCLIDVPSHNCIELVWGILPESCSPLFE